jgi:hypothetical protein
MAKKYLSVGLLNDVVNELIIAAHRSLDLGLISDETYRHICDDLANIKVCVLS